MSYAFYNWIHVFTLIGVFSSLGAITIYAATGGQKADFKFRKMLGITHGVLMVIAFIAGFGLMARGGYSFGNDPWLFAKILIWLIVGAYPAFVWRLKGKGILLFWGLFIIAIIATYIALFKFGVPQFRN